jgi:hypothetical protein
MPFSMPCPLCAAHCQSALFGSHSLIVRCATCSTFIVDNDACMLLESARHTPGAAPIIEALQQSSRAATIEGLCIAITGNLETGSVTSSTNGRMTPAIYQLTPTPAPQPHAMR